MPQFFESIKLQNGKWFHLELHAERMNNTRKQFFDNVKPINLKSILPAAADCPEGLYKFKVVYDKNIVEIDPQVYTLKPHNKVQLVENNSINYEYKSVDRQALESFENADDAIFIKNQKLTDASYSNIVLQKDEQWFTPKNCLLKGIKRQILIRNKKIIETEITQENLSTFDKIAFVNAMRDFELIYTFKIENQNLILSLC